MSVTLCGLAPPCHLAQAPQHRRHLWLRRGYLVLCTAHSFGYITSQTASSSPYQITNLLEHLSSLTTFVTFGFVLCGITVHFPFREFTLPREAASECFLDQWHIKDSQELLMKTDDQICCPALESPDILFSAFVSTTGTVSGSYKTVAC